MNQLTKKGMYQKCQDAIDFKVKIERDFLEWGAMLYQIKNERLYEAGWDSWEEYEMELKVSPATISKLMRIYEVFVLQYKISQAKIAAAGGWSVVAEILPALPENAEKGEVEDWLDRATTESRTDIRRSLREKKTGQSMRDCKHPNAYEIRICPDCGERERIYKA